MSGAGPGGGGGAAPTKQTMDTDAFNELERSFTDTLSKMSGDDTLEKFKFEYEKLYEAFKKSHKGEQRLITRVRELSEEIVENAKKVQTALKLSEDDQVTILDLKEEIKKAWNMVDAAHEKEMRAKDTIKELRKEIDEMTVLIEKGAGLTADHEQQVELLEGKHSDLLRKLEEKQKELESHQDAIQGLHGKVNRKRAKAKTHKETISEQAEAIREKDAEARREARRKERVNQELTDLRTRLDESQQRVKHVDAQNAEGDLRRKKLEIQVKESRGQVDKFVRENKVLLGKMSELSVQAEDLMQRNEGLQKDMLKLDSEIVSRDRTIARQKEDLARATRMLDSEKKQTGRLQSKRAEEKTEREQLASQINVLSKDTMQVQREADAKAKKVAELQRGQDMTQKQLLKQHMKVKKEEEKVQLVKREMGQLASELTTFEQEAQKQRKLIYKLDKARERADAEASEFQGKYQQQLEQAKLKERTIDEMQKQISELTAKLKQQENLYEAVRSDRNLYSKNLIESQDEIAEMKRKFKIMNHQIEQLKEEITAKDHALVKEHFDHQKVEKQREQLKNELDKLKKLKGKAESTIEKQHAELGKLTSIIQKLESDAIQQHKEYDQVINERDILGTQLIRRNDELALLYEKLKIQQSTLNKGEVQYSNRVQDIRLMQLQVQDLSRKLKISTEMAGQVPELKREIKTRYKELLRERNKVTRLSNELENPMNLHRWRQLEGSDPETHELLQRIRTLQRRLIKKTEEVVEKDFVIQEKEKLYVELKSILARQPGPEVAEQLSVYQQSLKDKTRQMKSMASELNMYQAQANEYKYEIERLMQEVQDVKRKYYAQKRANKQAKFAAGGVGALGLSKRGRPVPAVSETSQAQEQRLAAQQTASRMIGGGFNLTQ